MKKANTRKYLYTILALGGDYVIEYPYKDDEGIIDEVNEFFDLSEVRGIRGRNDRIVWDNPRY